MVFLLFGYSSFLLLIEGKLSFSGLQSVFTVSDHFMFMMLLFRVSTTFKGFDPLFSLIRYMHV